VIGALTVAPTGAVARGGPLNTRVSVSLPSAVRTGASVSISGHLPWRAGVRVLLQQRVGQRWRRWQAAASSEGVNPASLRLGGERRCRRRASVYESCWCAARQSCVLATRTVTIREAPPPRSSSKGIAIAAGDSHSCALLSTGTVDCWGNNSSGELGHTTTGSCSHMTCATPMAVTGIANAIAVTAGGGYSCALLATGGIDCWGIDNTGERGTGPRLGARRWSAWPGSVMRPRSPPAAITLAPCS
jgi:hypothetical protein